MPPQISIVVPAYNEAARLSMTLSTILTYLNEHEPDAELIVVADGSNDDTAAVAEASLANIPRVAKRVSRYALNRATGHAECTGLLTESANIVFVSDADRSTPMCATLN